MSRERVICLSKETSKGLIEKHILNLKPGRELRITGLNSPFRDTNPVGSNKHDLLYIASDVKDKLNSKPEQYQHIIDNLKGEYTIKRLK